MAEHGTLRPAPRQSPPDNAQMAFQGVLFEVWQWEQKLFDGSSVTFESLRRPDTVLVLPVRQDGTLLLVHQLHPGDRRSRLRVLSGRVKAGEIPEQTARRELGEEIGIVAGEFRLWDAWQPIEKVDWAVYLFIAHNLATGPALRSDPRERVTAQPIPIDRLFEDEFVYELDHPEFTSKLFEAQSSPQTKARVMALLAV